MKTFIFIVRVIIILIVALIVLRLVASAEGGPVQPAQIRDPEGDVLRLFDTYDLVAVGERHRSKEVHEFLRSLVRDSRLVKHDVTNIVVEFGNAKFQNVADNYVLGGNATPADVQRIWRDTTQFLVWDSPLYQEFFRTVREVNTHLPRSKKIRVILGDPPIGWEIVHTKADYELYADRDLFYADVVQREVLNRGQKALLIAGGMHFINSREPNKDVPDRKRSAGDLLHRRHPGKLFAFWHAAIPEGRCGSPCVVVVHGSRFQNESFAMFAPKGILTQKVVDGEKRWVPLETADWPTTAEMTDGLLDFGPSSTIVDPVAAVYYDSIYTKELRRRAAIMSDVYGMDFGESLDRVVPPKDLRPRKQKAY